jgi:hypothetical protein
MMTLNLDLAVAMDWQASYLPVQIWKAPQSRVHGESSWQEDGNLSSNNHNEIADC